MAGVIVSVLCALTGGRTDATPPPQMPVIGSWGGPVNTMAVNGSLAYVGIGQRVVIVDVTDPSNLIELSDIDLVQAVRDVAYRDGYLYVATDQKPYRFCVIDVSNPRAPHFAWTTPLSASTLDPLGVQLEGNRAYVRTDDDLWVYDITNPTSVQILGIAIESVVQDAVIRDGLAYVAGAEGGEDAILNVYDVATPGPLSPTLLGSVTIQPGSATEQFHLALSGDRAYVTHRHWDFTESSLAVIDITSPSTPTVLSDAPIAGATIGIGGIDVQGGHLYVAQEVKPGDPSGAASEPDWPTVYPGLCIYAVGGKSDAPKLIATYKDHAGLLGVKAEGDRAYVFDQGEGVVILDVSTPAKPTRIGNLHSPAFLGPMVKVDNLIYVTDFWNGLTILDVSDPTRPEVVGVYQTPYGPQGQLSAVNCWGIAVKGVHAFMTASGDGVHIINVSNPSAPTLMLKLPPPTPQFRSVGLAVRGNLLHVAFEDYVPPSADPWRLRTYNLAPAAKYGVLSTLEVIGAQVSAPQTIATNPAGFAFMGRIGTLTQTIDVEPPTSPALIYQGETEAYDVAVDESLWLGSTNSYGDTANEGITLKDVSDPTRPVPLSFIHGKKASGVALQNGRAYAIGDFNSLDPRLPAGVPSLPFTHGQECLVFDVNDPANPLPIGWSPYIGRATKTSLLVDEPHIFVTAASPGTMIGEGDQSQGLVVLEAPALPQPADLNGDGVVNGFDLALLLGAWGRCPAKGNCAGDLDGNGVVNGFDLALLLGAWTTR